METLSEEDWDRIVSTVTDGQCILLLGPAVAITDDDDTPLTTRLARQLAEEIGDPQAVVNKDDLAHVAQAYVHPYQRIRRDHFALRKRVVDYYQQFEGQTTSLHDALAQLPFTLCISTTPDHFLKSGFERAGKQPQVYHYNFRDSRHHVRIPDPDPKYPVIFNLYGDVDEPRSLVLTEDDLLKFLVTAIKGVPALPASLVSRFSQQSTTFLFLGFGFRQWHVRILLHILQDARHEHISLALEDKSFFAHPRHAETAMFYYDKYSIDIKMISWRSFVDELSKRHDLGQMTGASDASRSGGQSTPPRVFFSYCHEDRAVVGPIASEIEKAGVRVWVDDKDIRGGDAWDSLIESVLHQVDYVVVFQSPNLDKRQKSYVFKEVNIALEQQQYYRDGRNFIIPVALGKCERIPRLKALHTIDVSGADGVDKLVDAIMTNWSAQQQRGGS